MPGVRSATYVHLYTPTTLYGEKITNFYGSLKKNLFVLMGFFLLIDASVAS